MLHLIEGARPHLADAVLRNMFEARKRVFVDLLGWDVPVLAERYEMDQFDTPHALYLVLTDRAGGHRASARLLPTTRPHILEGLYASLCDGPVPRGDDIYEITRFCLERTLPARERRTARDQLIAALASFGLDHGIRLYTGVAEPVWLRQILAFGWRCRQLGPERVIDGVALGALEIELSADTPDLLRRGGLLAPMVAPESHHVH